MQNLGSRSSSPRTIGLCAALLTATSLTAQTTLATIYTGGNSLNSPCSVQFNATVLNPNGLVVTGFEVNCENTRNGPIGSTFQIDVYVTDLGGTYVGNETNAGAWHLIATGTATSNALGTPTPIDISDFFLPAGRHGIALQFVIPTGQLGTAVAYTNGNGTNQSFADANLQLDLGTSCTGFFAGPIYSPRVFNGAVVYEAGTNAAYGNYGTGCDGGSASGTPQLRPNPVTGDPVLGMVWEQDLSNLSPTPGVGIMIFGLSFSMWGPWTLPYDLTLFGLPGCNAYIPPDATVFFGHSGSTHTYLSAFPNNPAFAGIAVGTQALLLDPTATNPVGATLTNLCAGRIGN